MSLRLVVRSRLRQDQTLESRSALMISVESEKLRPEAASLSENSRAFLAQRLGSPVAFLEGFILVFLPVIVRYLLFIIILSISQRPHRDRLRGEVTRRRRHASSFTTLAGSARRHPHRRPTQSSA